MTSATPLIADSWKYEDNILRNLGDEGMEHSNNHTHLHKYKGEWYMFYHTLNFQRKVGVTGGYRSISVDKIKVDEENVKIEMASMTQQGVDQIQKLDVSFPQPASQASATFGIIYEETDVPGQIIVHANGSGQGFKVSGIKSQKIPSHLLVNVKGKWRIALRTGSPKGEVLSSVEFNNDNWEDVKAKVSPKINTTDDIFFTFEEGDFYFKEWQVK